MINRFLLALQFLTRIPVRKHIQVNDQEFANSALFYPIIGIIVGGMQVLLFLALDWALSPLVIALFLLIAPIALTGAFHLEGLSDTADGFLSSRDSEGMLRIMKDSHIGTMGMIVVASFLLAKFVFLYEVLQNLNSFLVVGVLLFIPCLSRWGMVIAAGASKYARSGPGLGRSFTEGIGKKIVILSGIIPVVATIAYLKIIGGICVIIAILSALAGAWLSKRKINGVTGDVLGGINEMIEAILLFSVIVIDGFK